MRFDLDGVGVEGQAEADFDEVAAVGFPIDVGIGDHVGVVVADCAVDFAEEFLCLKVFKLALQAVHDVGGFFAQGGRRGGLAVGAAHHGDGGKIVRHAGEFFDDFGKFGQDDGFARFLQHQGVGQVVDVFAGAGEVDELAGSGDFGYAGEAFLEPVFDGFDIMIGGRFDGFDGGCVFQ